MRELRRLGTALLLITLSSTTLAMAPVPALALSQPGSPEAVPVVLDGSQAVVRWRNPDPSVTRVVVRRSTGTVAPASPTDGTPVFDGAPAAGLQLVTNTVVVGTTYTYGYWSFVGTSASPEAVHRIKATAPGLLRAPQVVSDVGAGPTFGLSWNNPANPAGTPYTVKYATTASGPWTIWLLDTVTSHATFGAASQPITARPGATYRLEVLSQDPYGNDTRHALATVVEPYDTRSAALSSGWQTLTSSRRWAATVAVTSHPGATATFHVSGTKLTVIGDACPGCGRIIVVVDGRSRLVADTHSTRLAVRRHLASVERLPAGRHVVVIKVVGTTGRPALHLDGLAVVT